MQSGCQRMDGDPNLGQGMHFLLYLNGHFPIRLQWFYRILSMIRYQAQTKGKKMRSKMEKK